MSKTLKGDVNIKRKHQQNSSNIKVMLRKKSYSKTYINLKAKIHHIKAILKQ